MQTHSTKVIIYLISGKYNEWESIIPLFGDIILNEIRNYTQEGGIVIFPLHHFALICSEMGTFAMSKRANYK